MIDRLQRVAELIKRSISVILQSDIDEPLMEYITITHVEVTKDLRLAKVYYICSEDLRDADKIPLILKKHSRYIRGLLSENVSMKYTPTISFREDTLEKHQRHVDELFQKLESEKKQKVDQDQGEGAVDEF